MKSSHHAEPAASTHYAPSVPMSVYRELAAELRANKAVIDSLNSRNQQLIEQNQFLKQEIHNVVQATLNLGQAAGVARQATQGFPNAASPDTLAKLVQAEVNAQANAQKEAHLQNLAGERALEIPQQRAQQHTHTPHQVEPHQVAATQPIAPQPVAKSMPRAPKSPSAVPPIPRNRVPRPIAPQANTPAAQQAAANASAAKAVAKKQAAAQPKARRQPTGQPTSQPAGKQALKPNHPANYRTTETIPGKGTMTQRPAGKPKAATAGKLFTEQSGEYRSSALESEENKEIGGIWLALSIILIIVTAFGAGFLIMKPLLNDR